MAQKRQLVAILFADIRDFTALVQQDEGGAKIIQDKFHKVLETVIRMCHGRVVHFKGDGGCCIFRSAVDAVLAAIDVQQQMLQEPKVPLRIGIHLGDVIVEEKDIFGDGVNIASRVESFALPGSVFITENVFHEIRNHADIRAISLGKFEFKNVKENIEIYAISNSGLVIPDHKKLTGKGKYLANKKYWFGIGALFTFLAIAGFLYFILFKSPINSIAVIPFENLGTLHDGEKIIDGVTEDISMSLAPITGLKVIAFSSTKQYRGSHKSIKQIAAELNVSYILSGSMKSDGGNMQIKTQLIKADDESYVWVKDTSFSEVFAIKGLVASEVTSALKVNLSTAEKNRIEKYPTLNPEAYQFYLIGRYYWNLRTPKEIDTSIQFFNKAMLLDPKYALAYSGIADAYTVSVDNGYLNIDSGSVKAKAALNKALALDSSLVEVRASRAIYLSSIEGNGAAAISELEKVIRLNPNYASAFQFYAIELSAKGQFKEAKEMIEKAIALDPRSKRMYSSKALIYFNANDINKAINVLKQAPEGFSNDLSYIRFLSRLYYLKGEADSAAYYAQLCKDEILLSMIKKDKPTAKKLIIEKSREPAITAEEIASYYTMSGEKDSAFVWLNKSVKNKEYGGLKFLAVSPNWEPLRNDPRFALLIQNSGIR